MSLYLSNKTTYVSIFWGVIFACQSISPTQIDWSLLKQLNRCKRSLRSRYIFELTKKICYGKQKKLSHLFPVTGLIYAWSRSFYIDFIITLTPEHKRKGCEFLKIYKSTQTGRKGERETEQGKFKRSLVCDTSLWILFKLLHGLDRPESFIFVSSKWKSVRKDNKCLPLIYK